MRAGEALADGAAGTRRARLPRVDYLVGGFPCQDLSSAGKRVGIDGERSGLWREFVRLIGELQPRGVVLENVHHAWRQWVPELRRALWTLGYASLPIRLRASDFGAWHERSRVFVVAHVDASVLRLESWRREWPYWPDSPLFADAADGEQFASERGTQPPQSERASERSRRRVDDGDPATADVAEARPADSGEFAAAGWRGLGGVAADADTLRELQPQGRESDEWRRSGDSGWWTAEPDVVRVVHGVSSRLDGRRMAARIGALGNAVVPPELLWIAERLREAEAVEAARQPAC